MWLCRSICHQWLYNCTRRSSERKISSLSFLKQSNCADREQPLTTVSTGHTGIMFSSLYHIYKYAKQEISLAGHAGLHWNIPNGSLSPALATELGIEAASPVITSCRGTPTWPGILWWWSVRASCFQKFQTLNLWFPKMQKPKVRLIREY